MRIVLLGNGILGSTFAELYGSSLYTHLKREDLDLCMDLDSMRRAITSKLNSILYEEVIIINTAAYTNVTEAETKREESSQVNTFGPARLAAICKEFGISLVHVSTDFVFDGMRPRRFPYEEEDLPHPMNWYGKSKLRGEQQIKASLCDYVIIRTGWLYNNEKGIIPSMVKAILTKRSITAIQDQVYAPTHAEDLAKQLKLIVDNKIKGIVHATPSGSLRPYELLEHISQKLNKTIIIDRVNRYNYFRDGVFRPAMCLLKNERLESLGLNIMPHWELSVDKCVEACLERFKNTQ